MKAKVLLMGLFMMFVAVSCNKDQQAVRKLDGKWKLNKFNGLIVAPENMDVWTFNACKLKTDQVCDVTEMSQGEVTKYKYMVIDDGKTLVKKAESGTVTIQTYTIETLDKIHLKMSYSNGIDNFNVEFLKQ